MPFAHEKLDVYNLALDSSRSLTKSSHSFRAVVATSPIMGRAVALTRGARVELEDLPEEIRQAFPKPVVTTGAVRPLDEIEREYIIAALELNRGNQRHTAEQLKIGSATLYRKLKSYGLIGKPRSREAVPS